MQQTFFDLKGEQLTLTAIEKFSSFIEYNWCLLICVFYRTVVFILHQDVSVTLIQEPSYFTTVKIELLRKSGLVVCLRGFRDGLS